MSLCSRQQMLPIDSIERVHLPAPVIGLMSGTLDLHVSGMTLVVWLQVVWNVLIGWFLVKDKILTTNR